MIAWVLPHFIDKVPINVRCSVSITLELPIFLSYVFDPFITHSLPSLTPHAHSPILALLLLRLGRMAASKEHLLDRANGMMKSSRGQPLEEKLRAVAQRFVALRCWECRR